MILCSALYHWSLGDKSCLCQVFLAQNEGVDSVISFGGCGASGWMTGMILEGLDKDRKGDVFDMTSRFLAVFDPKAWREVHRRWDSVGCCLRKSVSGSEDESNKLCVNYKSHSFNIHIIQQSQDMRYKLHNHISIPTWDANPPHLSISCFFPESVAYTCLDLSRCGQYGREKINETRRGSNLSGTCNVGVGWCMPPWLVENTCRHELHGGYWYSYWSTLHTTWEGVSNTSCCESATAWMVSAAKSCIMYYL